MASLPSGDAYTKMRSMKWSPAEKAAARRAFDLALHKELDDVMRQTKEQASRIKQPSHLWDLENFLTRRRKEIDSKYDYRYSVLPMVFGQLIREGRLMIEDLHGLGEDKRAHIRRYAK
jgi:hypothetical protein